MLWYKNSNSDDFELDDSFNFRKNFSWWDDENFSSSDNNNINLYNENEKAKSRSFNFYLDTDTKYIDDTYFDGVTIKDSMLVYTDEKGYNELLKLSNNVNILKTFMSTRVSKITINFLNPNTRLKSLKKKYLLRCA